MSYRHKVAAAGVAGVLSLTGIGVAAAQGSAPNAIPGAVATQETQPESTDREQAIQEALAGLVTDGTLTQEQADQVVEALGDAAELRPGHGGGGHDGPGRGGAFAPEAAATALGLTQEELREALREDGATLADVAEAQGVPVDTLVESLVTAGTEHLQQAVTDGRLIQEQADERIAELPDRVAEAVEQELGQGRGHGPMRPGADDEAPADDAASTSST